MTPFTHDTFGTLDAHAITSLKRFEPIERYHLVTEVCHALDGIGALNVNSEFAGMSSLLLPAADAATLERAADILRDLREVLALMERDPVLGPIPDDDEADLDD